MVKVAFKKLSENAVIPHYATEGSAGFDLSALLDRDITVKNMEIVLIKTGLSVAIPDGYEIQIRSRSGTSLKKGLIVLNAPGTIDSDYRGEVGVIIQNVSGFEQTIASGDRVAQGILARVERVDFEIVDELPETQRGEGGFGSTGVN